MTRIQAMDPAFATGKARTLLDTVKAKMGIVPNLTRVLANAPAALEGYLNFSGALAGGEFDAKVREQIALTVAQANLCDYCLSAHTLIGGKVGLSTDDIQAARAAISTTPRTDAILKLARAIVVSRGEVTDPDLRAARHAGLGDSEIVETVANVALNIFTNYLNHAAQTVIDFPKVESGLTHAHSCDTGACSTKN